MIILHLVNLLVIIILDLLRIILMINILLVQSIVFHLYAPYIIVLFGNQARCLLQLFLKILGRLLLLLKVISKPVNFLF